MQTHPKGCLPSEVPVGMMAKRLSSINYHSGYILRGFPLTLEQSSIFLSIFCRSADLLIPIFLNISEDQVQDRIPENDHGVTRRRADFEAGKEEVLTLLSPLSSFKQLDLIGSEDKYDVFHRVCLTVNRQLDAMQAEKQRSQIASPRQESMELSLSQIGWTTACVASVAVIAFLAGRYIHRD